MRIVHLLSCEGPYGDAAAALYLARLQRMAGCDASVLIKQGPLVGQFLARAQGSGVPVTVLQRVELDPSVGAPSYVAHLWRELVRRRPQIVHLHERGLTSKASDVAAARAAGARRVVTTAHYFGDFLGSSEEVERSMAAWRKASRWVDAVIAPSHKAAETQRLAGVTAEKLVVIHNVVDLDVAEASGEAVRAELGIGDDDFLVLFLARLDPVKQPLLAIDAFARVVRTVPTARLAIAGNGPLRQACEARIDQLGIAGSVTMLGFRTDVRALLQAADILHAPAEAEAFGLAILEAVSSNTPVVATDIAPVAGEVLPADGALFHGVGDVEGAAAAILELASDARLRCSLAETAAAYARVHHDPVVLCQRHFDVYARPGGAGRMSRSKG